MLIGIGHSLSLTCQPTSEDVTLYGRHHSTTILVPLSAPRFAPLSAPRFAPERGYREHVTSNVLRIQVDESALVCLFYFTLAKLTPPHPPTPLPSRSTS